MISDDTMEFIFSQLGEGRSARDACEEVGVSRSVFFRAAASERWRGRYAQARDEQHAAWADELTRPTKPRDAVEAAAHRLRHDNIKWLLARTVAAYADKSNVQLTGANGGPIQQQTTVIDTSQVDAALDAVLKPDPRPASRRSH